MLDREPEVGSRADRRHDHARARRTTASSRGSPRRSSKDGDVGRRRPQRRHARARQQLDDLLHLPHLVDADLLRLPPLDGRQPQDADAPQRGADDAELDGLQLPDPARRLVHPRPGRHGHEATASHRCARPARSWSARRTSRARGSTTAADGVGRGLQRAGVQHLRAAHRAREGDQAAAPTATSRPTATTTPGWPSCCCRARTS